ncbi:ATP-dependent DNA helicase [Aliikangiella marina]|uniref:ATP-dependent DNA helicase n=1 Tax=Aliikangiella marina TaxID=1712262 RepID=A0A545T6F4_9GAMM|nr:ATP-dependent DNA helicase [Aliikangiella marina]TQV72810.1 ATP-dependent DNA helicase [Aliikangiella marina]
MSGSKKEIKLSVRTLVEFSARSGDLFSESSFGPSAKEGIKGHQTLQNSRNSEWEKEFAVKQTIEYKNYSVTLGGRIDLVNRVQSPAIVEEIKTTYFDQEDIPQEKIILHLAQTTVYCYLLHLEQTQSAEALNPEQTYVLKTTWFNLLDNSEFSSEQSITSLEAKKITENYLDIYLTWFSAVEERQLIVRDSAKTIAFPYTEYRTGQHYFAKAVYQTIKDKKQLLVEAPTGSGKTMSTLFASSKAIGEGIIAQIVYLTAKGSGQQAALKNTQKLIESGLEIDYVVLQAKDKACPCRSSKESIRQTCDNGKGVCSRTIGFFDRLPQARLACLEAAYLSSEKIQEIAAANHICPFELSLQMVRWSSIVICDFNYFLDPMVRLSAFDDNINQRVLLIDEYHNLIERSRGMYSAELTSAPAHAILRQLKKNSPLKSPIKRYLEQLVQLTNPQENLFSVTQQKRSDDTDQVIESPPEVLKFCLEHLFEEVSNESLSDGFAGGMNNHQIEGFHDWLKSLYRYYFISELYSEDHKTIISGTRSTSSQKLAVSLKLLCLDPASYLTKKYQSARALIGFSATVTPLDYYSQVTGLSEDSVKLKLPPVFPIENQLTVRCDFIDTRWKHRDSSISLLCDLILSTIHAKPGKYLVFLPSYAYLTQCYDHFVQANQEISTIKQQKNSTDKEKSTFLKAFFECADSLLGFAILGGVFGEGVDFSGEALDGVIVIGAGMPQPSLEQNLIEQHIEDKGFNGFKYNYQFPGFTRVKQTAGRVIRSETDKGVVILVDPRFRRLDYQNLMPDNWHVRPCSNLEQVQHTLEQFWRSSGDN